MRVLVSVPFALTLCASLANAQPAAPAQTAPNPADSIEIGGVAFILPQPPGFLREDGLFPEFETQVIERTGADMKLVESYVPAAHAIKGREANWQWRAAQLSFDTVYLVVTLFSSEYIDIDAITFAAIKKTARQGFNGLASKPAIERTEMDGAMHIKIGPASLVGELIDKPRFIMAVINTPVQRSVDGIAETTDVLDARAVVHLKGRAFYLQSYSRPRNIEERLRFHDNMLNWVESVISANAEKP